MRHCADVNIRQGQAEVEQPVSAGRRKGRRRIMRNCSGLGAGAPRGAGVRLQEAGIGAAAHLSVRGFPDWGISIQDRRVRRGAIVWPCCPLRSCAGGCREISKFTPRTAIFPEVTGGTSAAVELRYPVRGAARCWLGNLTGLSPVAPGNPRLVRSVRQDVFQRK